MQFNNVFLNSIEYVLPEKILSSEEIEFQLKEVYQRLKLPFGRLELMTGISERRYWEPGTLPSTVATEAGRKCLEIQNIDPNKVTTLIYAGVCRNFLEPATASVVHSNLKLKSTCRYFDLSNACLGVIQAMELAAELLQHKTPQTILIVTGENSGPLLLKTIETLKNDNSLTRKNIKKYIANLTIGSAATGVILSNNNESNKEIKCIESLTDSKSNHLCQGGGNTDHLFMETDSEKLLVAGMRLAKENWELFCSKHEDFVSRSHFYCTHQVGSAHDQLLKSELKINNEWDTEVTYPFLGNTGSAALPVTFKYLLDNNEIKENENICLMGIGSGLSSTVMGIQC